MMQLLLPGSVLHSEKTLPPKMCSIKSKQVNYSQNLCDFDKGSILKAFKCCCSWWMIRTLKSGPAHLAFIGIIEKCLLLCLNIAARL